MENKILYDDRTKETIETYNVSAKPYQDKFMDELTIWGAFDNNELIGIIGTKLNGIHISLFFINQDYHRKGIGRELFNCAYANQIVEKITVNSSSYAVEFYESLGFSKTAEEQETDGLRYIPMVKIFSPKRA